MFTRGDIKLYLICGVGFMLDAYDLFIINLVNPIWTYEYWGGLPGPHHLKKTAYPLLLKGAVNAAANIGNIIGQVSFGFMGDTFGRKFVYGSVPVTSMLLLSLSITDSPQTERNSSSAWSASSWSSPSPTLFPAVPSTRHGTSSVSVF